MTHDTHEDYFCLPFSTLVSGPTFLHTVDDRILEKRWVLGLHPKPNVSKRRFGCQIGGTPKLAGFPVNTPQESSSPKATPPFDLGPATSSLSLILEAPCRTRPMKPAGSHFFENGTQKWPQLFFL